LVTLRFICSCPNFSAVAFKQPRLVLGLKFLNDIFYSLLCSSFSFSSFIVVCVFKVSFGMPMMMLVFGQT
jgi:hypothetical protein